MRRVTEILAIAALLGALIVVSGCATTGESGGGTRAAPGPGSEAKVVDGVVVIHDEAEVDRQTSSEFESGLAALNAGDNEKGIQLFEEVVRRSPNLTAPYINLAIAYEKVGNFQSAEENIKHALKLSPEHPAANNEYGLLYRKTGRFAEARSTYERILLKYPNFAPARKNLGILCDLYLRDLDCALSNYRLYGAAVPADKSVALWIADLEKRLGRVAP